MPTDIQSLLSVDYKSLFVSVVIVMVGWVTLKTIFDKFTAASGIEFSWSRKIREQKERTAKMEKHMDDIDKRTTSITEEIKTLTNNVNTLAENVTAMQEKQCASERARLKDRILQAYRLYKKKGSWSEMEREAMLGLIQSYRENGEYNTYVNEVIAVDIENFKIIDTLD
jgi:septal ring factor EnvC (AmiA/AmiB activator)